MNLLDLFLVAVTTQLVAVVVVVVVDEVKVVNNLNYLVHNHLL
jgi:hypothetical protein